MDCVFHEMQTWWERGDAQHMIWTWPINQCYVDGSADTVLSSLSHLYLFRFRSGLHCSYSNSWVPLLRRADFLWRNGIIFISLNPNPSVTIAVLGALSKSNWKIFIQMVPGLDYISEHGMDRCLPKLRKSYFLKAFLNWFSECTLLLQLCPAAHSHFPPSRTKKLLSPNIEHTIGSWVGKMSVKCLAQGRSLNDTFSHGIKKCFSSSAVQIFTACPGIRTGNLLVPSSGL